MKQINMNQTSPKNSGAKRAKLMIASIAVVSLMTGCQSMRGMGSSGMMHCHDDGRSPPAEHCKGDNNAHHAATHK